MKILLGLSGGVDSAYAAHRLIREGHTVIGVVLIMHEYTELLAAEEAARSIGIPLHKIDCREAFETIVKENFVSEYLRGRTPNPCIICNERVKFEYLYRVSRELGCDKIATGHYASVIQLGTGESMRYAICRASDAKKDQSYMLYRLPQYILESLVLPLSEMTKTEVRADSRAAGIASADRRDSQEICFLPDGNYPAYIESRAGKCPEGDFVDIHGNVLGRHKGIIHYTVGQRKGLGISLGERAFVTAIDPDSSRITLSSDQMGKCEVMLSSVVCSGIPQPASETEIEVTVKLRYTASAMPATARIYPDGTARLSFASPVRSAPGQSAVLYIGDTVVAGGFID